MTEPRPTWPVADIDHVAPPDGIETKAQQSLDKIAKLKSITGLKTALDTDPRVHDHLAEQLTGRIDAVHNRIVDLHPDTLDETTAVGMLLLFGTTGYQGSQSQRIRQREAVEVARVQLRGAYKSSVPADQRSVVFERLVSPPNNETDRYPRLTATLKKLSLEGTQKRHQIDELGGLTKDKAKVPMSTETAHAILLAETMRVLDYCYPPSSGEHLGV